MKESMHLELLRADKTSWKLIAYKPMKSEERGTYDAHEKARYSVLLSIQYDFTVEDEELIRYLFEQEVIARENDSFQGIGDAMWLVAYLLVQFERPEDIPLFYRAKYANFDTGCGFDREFMYMALRDNTESYMQKKYPEIYKRVQGSFDKDSITEHLNEWWQRFSSSYPSSEMDEPLLNLFYRNIYFDNLKKAKLYLDKWNQVEPDSQQKDRTLKYAYKEIGEFSLALELVKKELVLKETHWDKVSCYRDLLELYNQLGAPIEGLTIIKSIDKLLKQFDDWIDIGLGRMIIHEAFEYSVVTKEIEVAREAFEFADNWCQRMNCISLFALEAGYKAAERCHFKDKVKVFKAMVMSEKERIDQEMNTPE